MKVDKQVFEHLFISISDKIKSEQNSEGNYVRPSVLHLQNGVSIAEGWYGSVHSNPSYQPLSDPRGSEHVTLCNRIHA